MAQDKTYRVLTIGAAGLTQGLPLTDLVDIYSIKPLGGAVALAGNVTITGTGTPVIGSTYTFLFGGGFTLGAFGVSIFGTLLTAAQCLYKQIILCYYDGTTWNVYINSDDADNTDDVNGADIVDATVTNAKLSGNIALTKLASSAARGYAFRAGINGVPETFNAVTAGQILMGNGTDVVSQAISGDATLSSAGVLTLAANSVVTIDITDANVTLAKLESKLLVDTVVTDASFEANEVGAGYKIKMNYAGTISDIYVVVTRALAITDAGTVTLQNNAGVTMTVTTPISFPAASAIATAQSSAVTVNNTFIAGDIITITTAKATVGGKVKVSLKATRT